MDTLEKKPQNTWESTYDPNAYLNKWQAEKRRREKKKAVIRRIFSLIVILAILILSTMLAFANSQLKQQKALVLEQQAKNAELTQQIADLQAQVEELKLREQQYINSSTAAQSRPKAVYLTFDDGPGPNTEALLQVLKENNAKATFFLTGVQVEKFPELVKKISDAGHEVGLHSYSHNYQQIYASKEAFFEDFDKVEALVKKQTGKQPTMFRFPGGSNNAYLNTDVRKQIIAELDRRGYGYCDWNALTKDAEGKKLDSATLAANAIQTIGSQTHPVVLAHDGGGNSTPPDAVADIIKTMKGKGYQFQALTNTSPDLVHYAK